MRGGDPGAFSHVISMEGKCCVWVSCLSAPPSEMEMVILFSQLRLCHFSGCRCMFFHNIIMRGFFADLYVLNMCAVCMSYAYCAIALVIMCDY